jgi:hypothetical protein
VLFTWGFASMNYMLKQRYDAEWKEGAMISAKLIESLLQLLSNALQCYISFTVNAGCLRV